MIVIEQIGRWEIKTIEDRVVFLFKLLGEVEDQKMNGVYDDVDDNGNDKTTTEEFNDGTMITRTTMNVVLHDKMEIVFIMIMMMKMIIIYYIHTVNNNSNTNTSARNP